jgi:hypothetical protein
MFLLQSGRRPPSQAIDLICDELRTLIGEFADGGSLGWTRTNSQLLRSTNREKVVPPHSAELEPAAS